MSRSSHLRAAAACGAIFALSLGGLAACSKSTTDKVEDATASVVADASTAVSSVGADMDANKTEDFVTKAAIANLFEIKTSELAIKTSKTADVLTFAKMMVKDHTAAGKKFETAAAATSGLNPPVALDDDHQKKLDDLATKTGTDFDKAYVDIQQSAHSEAVSLFDDYAKNGKDTALQTFAADTLPTLQAHKDKIDAFKE
jgi:putative membrane protein